MLAAPKDSRRYRVDIPLLWEEHLGKALCECFPLAGNGRRGLGRKPLLSSTSAHYRSGVRIVRMPCPLTCRKTRMCDVACFLTKESADRAHSCRASPLSSRRHLICRSTWHVWRGRHICCAVPTSPELGSAGAVKPARSEAAKNEFGEEKTPGSLLVLFWLDTP